MTLDIVMTQDAPNSNARRDVVAAGIIFWNDKILLTKRKPDVPQGGLWEFPGGKQEVGEALEQCLQREIKEEIDIHVDQVQHFHTLRHHYPEQEVELHFFTCAFSGGTPKALGCDKVAWVNIPELSSFQFPEGNWPVIRKILAESESKQGSVE